MVFCSAKDVESASRLSQCLPPVAAPLCQQATTFCCSAKHLPTQHTCAPLRDSARYLPLCLPSSEPHPQVGMVLKGETPTHPSLQIRRAQAHQAQVLLMICGSPPSCLPQTDSGTKVLPKQYLNPLLTSPQEMLYLLFTRQLKPGKKRLSLLKRSLLCCHGYDELFLNSFFPFTTYNLYYDFYILFYFKYNFSNKLPFCLSLVTTKLPCDTVTPQSPSTHFSN